MCYEYDAIGNITKVLPAVYSNSTYSKVSTSENITYQYNNQQLLEKIITDSTTYTLGYNVYGQNNSIAIGNSEILSYTYNDYNGKLSRIEFSNGYTMRYVYNEVDGLTEIWYTNGEEETKAFEYSYTSSGLLYRFDNLIEQTAIIYKYDGENRLVQYVEFSTVSDVNQFATLYFYNDQGRVSSVFYHSDYSSPSGISKYSIHYYHAYNSDGSLWYFSVDTNTTNGEITYSYDAFDRLTTKVYDFYVDANTSSTFVIMSLSILCIITFLDDTIFTERTS